MSATKQACIGLIGFAIGGLDSIGPELLRRQPYPYHQWREAGGKNGTQTVRLERSSSVKKIHDPKGETDVFGVGRGRMPTRCLKCSHPSFIRGFRGLEGW
jgi:hypothetical protein